MWNFVIFFVATAVQDTSNGKEEFIQHSAGTKMHVLIFHVGFPAYDL